MGEGRRGGGGGEEERRGGEEVQAVRKNENPHLRGGGNKSLWDQAGRSATERFILAIENESLWDQVGRVAAD